MHKGYSECSFEYEHDLILNGVEYKEGLDAYNKRRVKPSEECMQQLEMESDKQEQMLYKTFGQNIDDTEREELVKTYQKELEECVFKNGGQLRDYQAEGVSWLMANHLNKRNSILADEMGLG